MTMHNRNSGNEPHTSQLNNNAGFSLVELLIAVIILAIIVIPFSRSFVVSARMNGNARRLQRATTVAQDIVEGLKAYNIDEIREQFKNPTDGFYITDSRLIHGRISEDVARAQADPNYNSSNPESPGVYYFAMEDFEIQGVEYDALIKLDASVYEEGHTNVPGATPDPNLHDNAFNAGDMSRPGSVIKGRDGSFSQPALFTQAVLTEIQERFTLTGPAAPPDPLDIDNAEEFSFKTFKNKGGTVIRTITLNIGKDHDGTAADGSAVTYFKADITFEYECKYNGNTELIYGRAESPVGEINGKDCAADEEMDSGNFYLFYYPLYDCKRPTGVSYDDKIIINNTSGKKLQVYIVKQVDSSSTLALSHSQLDAAERSYNAIVDVKDSMGNKDNVVIRTNLGMNLVDSAFLGGSGVRDPAKIPTGDVEKQDLHTQVKYQFNDADIPLGMNDSSMNVFGLAGTRFGGTGGISNEITEVIFDIEVSIYRPGAYAAGFPDEERMVVIEGSKNN